MRHAVPILAALAAFFAQPSLAQPALDSQKIEQIIGVKGTAIPEENVFKISKPRNDVPVEIDGWAAPPFMGLRSWVAFTPAPGGAMLMGDTVLFEDEVNPAMGAALDCGLEVTALHNRFFFDRPKVYFMHIAGMGDAGWLAAGVRAVWKAVAEVRAGAPVPSEGFGPPRIAARSAITPAPLEAILGVKGQASNGMFKAVIGRPASMHGIAIGKAMGVSTWAAFGGTDRDAIMDGDFVIAANELQTVLKAMRREGINIVSIHQHMTGEEPRILFLHYWAKGRAEALAQAFKHALDAQAGAAM